MAPKDKLVYQQVKDGNIDGIRSLRADGAGLEWMDKEGKTPLIVACMKPGLYNVAKTLIELGANVNAYRRHAGTPLHHAAKRGLDQTVQLLISHGATALVMNGDEQTPLELARVKGYSNVVRTIEARICVFSGWLKELHGLAPNYTSRKVWVVVLPCYSADPRILSMSNFELAVYADTQDPASRTVVGIWKANMKEPSINQPEPAVVVCDRNSRPRLRFAALTENDEQLLRLFYNACKRIPQVIPPAFPLVTEAPVVQASAPPIPEHGELDMAIQASLRSLTIQGPDPGPGPGPGPGPDPSSSTIHSSDSNPVASSSGTANNSEQDVPDTGIAGVPTAVQHTNQQHSSVIPSAPPAVDDGSAIHYPTIDPTLLDLSVPVLGISVSFTKPDELTEETSPKCVICMDAPVVGACVPCGHMACCMSCLNKIKAKKWGCPVCRADINQALRIYSV